MANILRGYVVETRTSSLMGPFLYSDFCFEGSDIRQSNVGEVVLDTSLNAFCRIPFIGIAAGMARIALAIIHTLGHLLCALLTLDRGHFYHAAKGVCEGLRGVIEAIPIAGRVFANLYSAEPPAWSSRHHEGYTWSWWILKIYNPDHPDALDRATGLWVRFREANSAAYLG